MCKIVGIYGEKGSGRKTAAWLIAKTLEEQIKGTSQESYKELFRTWVEEVCTNEGIIESTHHVIIDSFGDSILDTLKIFNPNLQEYDLHDEDIKDHTWVQLTTGKVWREISPQYHVLTPEQAIELDIKDNHIMNMRDYIIYWADWVIKGRFGENVWVNMIASTNELLCSRDHRIYWDVRTQGEIDYIRQTGGILVHLVNRKRHKLSGYRKIRSLGPNPVILNTQEGLSMCGELFWELSKKIRPDK